MFQNAQYFSSWGAQQYNWLNVAPADLEKNFKKNLDLLLNTNPLILSNQPLRQHGYTASFIRRRIKEIVAEKFIERVASYTDSNETFQEELEKFITAHLALSHYVFLRKIPANSRISVVPKKFWIPASYYICGLVNENEKNTLKMHFIDEQFFHNEFYETGEGRKHPAIVIECLTNGRFLMVPFTTKDGDGKLKVSVTVSGSGEQQFAIYKFYFEVSEAMLDQAGTEDYKGRAISDDAFKLLVDEIKKLQ
jgi:hypothetical protein